MLQRSINESYQVTPRTFAVRFKNPLIVSYIPTRKFQPTSQGKTHDSKTPRAAAVYQCPARRGSEAYTEKENTMNYQYKNYATTNKSYRWSSNVAPQVHQTPYRVVPAKSVPASVARAPQQPPPVLKPQPQPQRSMPTVIKPMWSDIARRAQTQSPRKETQWARKEELVRVNEGVTPRDDSVPVQSRFKAPPSSVAHMKKDMTNMTNKKGNTHKPAVQTGVYSKIFDIPYPYSIAEGRLWADVDPDEVLEDFVCFP